MNVTATTRLTAAECLARLAECPALPRGERLAAYVSDMLDGAKCKRPRMWLNYFDATAPRKLWRGGKSYGWPQPERIRQWAAPVRRLREERRALREALADVIGPPCEKRTRWCFTHQTNDCRADEARKLLVTP